MDTNSNSIHSRYELLVDREAAAAAAQQHLDQTQAAYNQNPTHESFEAFSQAVWDGAVADAHLDQTRQGLLNDVGPYGEAHAHPLEPTQDTARDEKANLAREYMADPSPENEARLQDFMAAEPTVHVHDHAPAHDHSADHDHGPGPGGSE